MPVVSSKSTGPVRIPAPTPRPKPPGYRPQDFATLPQTAWPRPDQLARNGYSMRDETRATMGMPQDYTPDRLVAWVGNTPEYYRDEWGVWHDKGGRPRPASYARQAGNAPLVDPDTVDPWLISCTQCGKALPTCRCRYRRLMRYSVPDGCWWYRLWVWCVIRLCG